MTKKTLSRNRCYQSLFNVARLVFVTALVSSLLACKLPGESGNNDNDKEKALVTGSKTVHHVTVDGLSREFIVYVPENAEGINAPAVFMLHGTSGDGEKYYNVSYWREKSDKEGIISVFPSALMHCFFEDENKDGDFDDPFEKKVTTKWAHGALGDPNEMPLCTAADIKEISNVENRRAVTHPLANDIAFFDSMLTFLKTNYTIDSKRVYISGFSNGGQMASRLAVERSNDYAAVASNAGAIQVSGPALRPISMVVSVGSLDDRFLSACDPAVDSGCVTAIPMTALLADEASFEAIVGAYRNALELDNVYTFKEMWAECGAPNCTVHADPAQCVDASTCIKLIKFTYAKSQGATAVNRLHVIIIDQATHEYPNGVNHPLIMAEYLWNDFFTDYVLP